VQHQKHDDGDPQQGGNHDHDAADDISQHGKWIR
jgi:hypothetical protein